VALGRVGRGGAGVQVAQRGARVLKLVDPLLDLVQVCLEQGGDVAAGRLPAVAHFEHVVDFGQRQARGLGGADEPQARDGFGGVVTVTARGPPGFV
jgi:hypothetical protein